MSKIIKEDALNNLEEIKKFVQEAGQKTEEKKKVVIEIKNRWTGLVKFASEKTTIKEAVQDNKANLYGANLSEANLYGANLYGANLYEANLSEANLYGANLSEANLSGADLYEANLSGADLSGANLYRANLYEANLSGADLSGANLYGAELAGAKFYGKGGSTKIKKSQINDFLKALGVIVEE